VFATPAALPVPTAAKKAGVAAQAVVLLPEGSGIKQLDQHLPDVP
jgi:hypothetical protein